MVSFRVPMEPLLEGKTLEFCLKKGSLDAILLLHPCDGEEAGGPKEVVMFLSYDDTSLWEKNLKLCVVFELLENVKRNCGGLLNTQWGVAISYIYGYTKVYNTNIQGIYKLRIIQSNTLPQS